MRMSYVGGNAQSATVIHPMAYLSLNQSASMVLKSSSLAFDFSKEIGMNTYIHPSLKNLAVLFKQYPTLVAVRKKRVSNASVYVCIY